MKIHILVEGPSERAFLERWLPRAFPQVEFKIHPHQGKGELTKWETDGGKRRGLLDMLPGKLRAYGKSATTNLGIMVLVDSDGKDCVALKKSLLSLLDRTNPKPNVVFRIAVIEVETFYLGDQRAIKSAFPKADIKKLREYDNDDPHVDAKELFADIINDDVSHNVQWAEKMGSKMAIAPAANISPSFRAFHQGIQKLIERGKPPIKKKRGKHWRAKTAQRPR